MTRASGGVDVFVALGANIGDPLVQMRAAAAALLSWFGDLDAAGVYRSAPEDGSDQPDYLNTVVRATTRLDADSILTFGKRLETRAGRLRSDRNAPRPLDVDLLFHGDLVCTNPRLTLPHPRWADRPFVVVPMLDLAPSWRDPATGRTVSDVAAAAGWAADSLEQVAAPGAILSSEPDEWR